MIEALARTPWCRLLNVLAVLERLLHAVSSLPRLENATLALLLGCRPHHTQATLQPSVNKKAAHTQNEHDVPRQPSH